jgi:ABC-type amino acid transport system permease subunit
VIAYTLTDVIVAWPLAFLLGVIVGLALASRYRIAKVRNGEL